MATPLDLRNRKREAQRATRLALNAVNRALDAWKAAVSIGKQHATKLTNAVLTSVHLPVLPLGVLADIPGLRHAAAAKLLQQQQAELLQLASCLARLQEAVSSLAVAAGSLRELVQLEEGAPLLGQGPVFAGLPLELLARMLGEIQGMHEAELLVKQAVLQGFQQIVDERGAANRSSSTASRAAFSRELHGGAVAARAAGGAATAAGDMEEQLRRRMQVYLTAWLLSPEVDDDTVATHVATITEDMRGF